MKLREGERAPNFSLRNSEKVEITLSDYRGQNVVLLFFPLAFTGTCTKELCAVRDDYKMFEALNAQIFAVSVDSLYTLGKFKEEQKYNFPLLSDFNKEVSRAYGSLYENFGFEMHGVSKRSAFVVDGNGIIRYAEVLENARDLPNFEKIKETLGSLN